MTNTSKLEIHLHFKNGETHLFEQSDPSLIGTVLSQINHKVFTQPSLLVYDSEAAIAYPGSALSGVSVLMDPVSPDLLNLDPHGNAEEITETEYIALRQELPPIVEGEPFVLLSEVRFFSGKTLWLKISVAQAASALQARGILHNVFTLPTLTCRRLGGGISLWNRAQFLSVSFSPKPETPLNAWPASRLEILSEE